MSKKSLGFVWHFLRSINDKSDLRDVYRPDKSQRKSSSTSSMPRGFSGFKRCEILKSYTTPINVCHGKRFFRLLRHLSFRAVSPTHAVLSLQKTSFKKETCLPHGTRKKNTLLFCDYSPVSRIEFKNTWITGRESCKDQGVLEQDNVYIYK